MGFVRLLRFSGEGAEGLGWVVMVEFGVVSLLLASRMRVEWVAAHVSTIPFLDACVRLLSSFLRPSLCLLLDGLQNSRVSRGQIQFLIIYAGFFNDLTGSRSNLS